VAINHSKDYFAADGNLMPLPRITIDQQQDVRVEEKH